MKVSKLTRAVIVIVITIFPANSKNVPPVREKSFSDDSSWLSRNETAKLDYPEPTDVETKDYEVCETVECKDIAEDFVSSMNESVDPCDDFYEFACGGWSARDPIPPSKASWSRTMFFQNTVQLRIKGILETQPDPSDILPVRQAKKWYRSCMDTENLERRGLKPIEAILIQAGGWPITMNDDEWDAEEYPWQKVERHYAHLTSAFTFHEVCVTDNALKINAPDFSLSDLQIVEGVANLFVQPNRANLSMNRLSAEAEKIVDFERELNELKRTREYVSMAFDEFVEWYDSNMTKVSPDSKTEIDWKSIVRELFNGNDDPSAQNWSSESKYPLNIYVSKKNIREIGRLLQRTPERTIVNYIHWNFVATMLPYTKSRAIDDLFKNVRKGFGIKERAPRWSKCINDMKMIHASAYVFVDKYFIKSTESAALKMIENIQIVIEDQIDNSNWLNDESKNWAKEKLKNMKVSIGFPDWYKNKSAVIHRYDGLTIGADYFDNTLSYMRYETTKKFRSIWDSKKKTDDMWSSINAVTVNAVYSNSLNMWSIPAANFQKPFFTPRFPNNINYAFAGVTAGHEIGHGFDTIGIVFGKDQNSAKLPADVLKHYYRVAGCFIDQFDGYLESYFGTKERGMDILTSAENIADSIGIQSAFEAYKRVRINSPRGETRLPGLEKYTDDQLFFLSFAASECVVERPEYEKKRKENGKRIESNHNIPPRFRVIGSISNTKYFAEAFNCPEDSPMNPSNKCSIWEMSKDKIEAENNDGSKERSLTFELFWLLFKLFGIDIE